MGDLSWAWVLIFGFIGAVWVTVWSLFAWWLGRGEKRQTERKMQRALAATKGDGESQMIHAASDLGIVYDSASSKLEIPPIFLKIHPYLLGGFLATLISAMQQSDIIKDRDAFQRLVNSLAKWLDENFGESEDEYFDEGSELEVLLSGMGDENPRVFEAIEIALNSLPDQEGWPRTEEQWRDLEREVDPNQ